MTDRMRVYDHLLGMRELNVHTLKSIIQVDTNYDTFVCYVADNLGIDSDRCLEIFQELEAEEYFFCMPQMDSHIDHIEID